MLIPPTALARRKKLYSDQLYMELTNFPGNNFLTNSPSETDYYDRMKANSNNNNNASLIFTIVSFRNLTRFLPKVYFSRNRYDEYFTRPVPVNN